MSLHGLLYGCIGAYGLLRCLLLPSSVFQHVNKMQSWVGVFPFYVFEPVASKIALLMTLFFTLFNIDILRKWEPKNILRPVVTPKTNRHQHVRLTYKWVRAGSALWGKPLTCRCKSVIPAVSLSCCLLVLEEEERSPWVRGCTFGSLCRCVLFHEVFVRWTSQAEQASLSQTCADRWGV